MNIILETDRLILRELLPSDEEGMFELDSNPEVHKYVGQKPVTSIEESRKVIEAFREQYNTNGIARWAAIEKETNQFIGWSGLKLYTETVNGQTGFYDIGYRLIQRYWGKGYATESAIAVRDYAFNQMQLKELIAMTDIDNIASQMVLAKIGMTIIKTFPYDGLPTWRVPGQLTNWHYMSNPNNSI